MLSFPTGTENRPVPVLVSQARDLGSAACSAACDNGVSCDSNLFSSVFFSRHPNITCFLSTKMTSKVVPLFRKFEVLGAGYALGSRPASSHQPPAIAGGSSLPPHSQPSHTNKLVKRPKKSLSWPHTPPLTLQRWQMVPVWQGRLRQRRWPSAW